MGKATGAQKERKSRAGRETTVKLGKAKDPKVKVELGDFLYKLIPLTKPVEDQLHELGQEIDNVDSDSESAPLDMVEAIAAQLDVMLEKHPSQEGDAPDPSSVVVEAYEAGETTLAEIGALVGDLVKKGRPN